MSFFIDGDVTYNAHEFVQPSAIELANSNTAGAMYGYHDVFAGQIESVYPPSHVRNRSKNQYEYRVQASYRGDTLIFIHCTLSDGFGGLADFETYTLKVGSKVQVMCVLGSIEHGTIIRGTRAFKPFIDQNLGHFWMRKFNNITTSITNDSTYYVKHVDGNTFQVTPTQVQITDGDNNTITVDKTAKTITISDGSGESLIFDKQAATVTIQAGKLNINVQGDVTLNASGNAEVNADTIKLNGDGAGIVTGGPTGVFPACFVTGIPIPMVPNVKAGP